MSGGRFNYYDLYLKGEIFGLGDRPTNTFEDLEISLMIWDVLNLIHDFDYYESSDSSEEKWLKSKKQFKEKWLKQDSERTKMIVDGAIERCKEELYKTFLEE